jgi:acyl-CoA thioester hydrolase
MQGPFRIPVRVYYQDTDAGGVVFHAQYLAFMERARSELLNAAGIDLARFTERHGVLFLVHKIAVTYHLPGRLNDLLSVGAEVAKMGRASLVFRQRVERGADLLVEADITVALVDASRMMPTRMPEELATALGAVQTKALNA